MPSSVSRMRSWPGWVSSIVASTTEPPPNRPEADRLRQFGEDRLGFFNPRLVANADLNHLSCSGQSRIADPRLAQQPPHIIHRRGQTVLDDVLALHLQQHVGAALQIETESQLLGWRQSGRLSACCWRSRRLGNGEHNASQNRKPDQGCFPTGEVQHVALGLAQKTNLCGVAPARRRTGPLSKFAAIP
jgi:hypothetical protein